MSDIAGKVAGAISLSAYIPFVAAILKKNARPNRATWLIWMVVNFVVVASYYTCGARGTIWVPVGYSVGTLVIAALSFKFGEGGWTRFDRSCLFGAVASGFLWWLFNSPFVALLMNIMIDFIGALPTIRKSYYNPESEDKTTWMLFFAGSLINLFAIEQWMFALIAYPIYLVFVIGIIVVLLFRPKYPKNA